MSLTKNFLSDCGHFLKVMAWNVTHNPSFIGWDLTDSLCFFFRPSFDWRSIGIEVNLSFEVYEFFDCDFKIFERFWRRTYLLEEPEAPEDINDAIEKLPVSSGESFTTFMPYGFSRPCGQASEKLTFVQFGDGEDDMPDPPPLLMVTGFSTGGGRIYRVIQGLEKIAEELEEEQS